MSQDDACRHMRGAVICMATDIFNRYGVRYDEWPFRVADLLRDDCSPQEERRLFEEFMRELQCCLDDSFLWWLLCMVTSLSDEAERIKCWLHVMRSLLRRIRNATLLEERWHAFQKRRQSH